MKIEEFSEVIRKALEERTGNEVIIQKVPKNNGVVLHGVNIMKPGTNVLPTLYLEPMLEKYNNGASNEEVVEQILAILKREKRTSNLDMSWFRDFESVKGKIAYKLVNYEANRELLKEVPHTRYLDLAKVYYVSVVTKELGTGTILLYNTHLELWGITREQLESLAEENTPKLFPAEIMSMSKALENVLGQESDEALEAEELPDMYIITNTKKYFGAAAMCYAEVLKQFAEQKDSDLIILPSSLHEIIILTQTMADDMKQLHETVEEVNRTQLPPDEVLYVLTEYGELKSIHYLPNDGQLMADFKTLELITKVEAMRWGIISPKKKYS